MTLDLSPWYEAREHIRLALEHDLQGGPEDQVIDEPPLDRFIVGILHPQDDGRESVDDEQDDTENAAVKGDDAVFDPAVALSRTRRPSSMGLTFAVSPELTRQLKITVSAARYVETDDHNSEDSQREQPIRHRGRRSHRRSRWTRLSVGPLEHRLDVTAPEVDRTDLAEGLQLYWSVRPPVDGIASITIVLINTTDAPGSGMRDGLCWFQPSITIACEDGEFAERPVGLFAGVVDDDVKSSALLFRGVRNLAVGHGCAVTWADDESVKILATTFMPWHDLLLSEASGGGVAPQRMRTLAEEGSDFGGLRALLDQYAVWISGLGQQLDQLPAGMRRTGERHVGAATIALKRMRRGLKVLESEPEAARAFRLMNAAMADQRSRQDFIRADAAGVVDDGSSQSWRPFQIAFILLNIDGLTHCESDDRQIADLLWFPTGGGKTEAYLGLIAYAILLRRLRDRTDGGVSVLMRYTLRLLTLQQFERAAGLVCALELIRRKHLPDTVPISLGLWVGRKATPNTVDRAGTALRKLQQGQSVDEENPVQLLGCPWCGADLGPDDYRIRVGPPPRMEVMCSDRECPFGSGLPVHVVDEDVYRERPSLVIATVDKFAMVAWRADVGALFSTDGSYSSPDLIIQDELHLISGPLGTMVGLYETAVDAAASRSGRPKLVASTATIRRATSQMRAVFDREAHQFPPAGLIADQSFFAQPAIPHEKGTRQYVGVLAPGISQTTLLVRTYAALLHAASTLTDDKVKDAYWTLLGYFNSLRVLGGAYMQVVDDVPDRMKVVAERLQQPQREIREPRELTSRKRSSEIPYELKVLGTSFPDPDAPDVVLATNMISVGVDVDRLGLMAVMGQPQTTAEYIQATSRVGRKYPGLVVTMYNATRSRDLSHYESFMTYHRSLYRQVEATGATPFAPRARDRGLHGVLVGLARLTVAGVAPDNAAGQVGDWEDDIRRSMGVIAQRAARVSAAEYQDADGEAVRARQKAEQEAVAEQLEDLLDLWLDAADDGRQRYPGWYGRHQDTLLTEAGRAMADEDVSFPVQDAPWPTLTSLRDVDAESSLYLIRRRRSARRDA
ncbi:helicase-related protein [Dactylosporangium sp. NPDC051541]|uniref:helicase-related protein n=1 Tax=Dactylosporangium sp. NPDC051541 TaxID=3363977 RepID=UPI0037A5944D